MNGNQIAAVIVAVGICIAGFFISNTLYKAKTLDRYVTVKGLSEMEVKADLAVWPIQITISSNDLVQLEKDISMQSEVLKGFFLEQGFREDEVSTGPPNIQDTRANYYGGGNNYNQARYITVVDFTVRTSDIPKLHEAVSKIPSIISRGIIIGSKNPWKQIEYSFTRLNEIKPKMIEEATKNAREVAEKFSKDSNSKVGKIRNASQGLFSITDKDVNTGYEKIVRVVSTVQFYLED